MVVKLPGTMPNCQPHHAFQVLLGAVDVQVTGRCILFEVELIMYTGGEEDAGPLLCTGSAGLQFLTSSSALSPFVIVMFVLNFWHASVSSWCWSSCDFVLLSRVAIRDSKPLS